MQWALVTNKGGYDPNAGFRFLKLVTFLSPRLTGYTGRLRNVDVGAADECIYR